MKKRIFLALLALLMVFPAHMSAIEYTGEKFVVLHDNFPEFSEDEIFTTAFVSYSELDDLGRVGPALACIGPEYPVGARSSVRAISPTGWQSSIYDFISGGYLFHRCHLIAHRFSGGGEVTENLFTGTEFLNRGAMYTVETTIAKYIAETGNHVMYRVTPDFLGNELVCRGVTIEALSVEDEVIRLNMYCFNVQPGVEIDFRTGANILAEFAALIDSDFDGYSSADELFHYVLNVKTRRFHYADCSFVAEIKSENRADFTGTRQEAMMMGYISCGFCKP